MKEVGNNLHDKIKNSFQSLKRKFFSDNFSEKDIPHYKELLKISDIECNDNMFINMYIIPCNEQKYPSFLYLSLPNDIKKELNITKNWVRVLFLYVYGDAQGNQRCELVLLYDFEKKAWYVRDYTYNPVKEFKITVSLKEFLLALFDPEKDPLLNSKVNVQKSQFDRDYLKWHRDMINKIG